MSDYVRSSPYLFRPVMRALLLGLAVLLLLAALVPAPLEPPADPGHPPNSAKAAWFLVWLQELVSYRTEAIFVAVGLALGFVLLPWLPLRRLERARWFSPGHRLLATGVLLAALFVLGLTLVGLFFRGPDWRLVRPF